MDFIPSAVPSPEASRWNARPDEGKHKHVSVVYAQANQTLSQVYKDTLERSEVADEELTEEQKKLVERMRALLEENVEVEDFLTGEKKIEPRESRAMIAYKEKRSAYDNAVTDYASRLARANSGTAADLVERQRSGGIYRRRATEALRDWIGTGYKNDVERAQATLSHILGSSMVQWKENLRAVLDDIENNTTGAFGYPFHPASVLPGAFARSQGWSTFQENELHRHSSSQTTSRRGAATVGFSLGIFSLGGGGGGGVTEHNSDFAQESFGLSFQYTTVEIMRPTFNPNFFLSRGWRPKDSFVRDYGPLHSNGEQTPKGAMIGYPTKALFIRDLHIQSAELASFMRSRQSDVDGGGIVGIGPFVLGGRYQQSNKQQESNLDIQGASIHVRGCSSWASCPRSSRTRPTPRQTSRSGSRSAAVMQDGLHVGLAAWICAQRAADGFVAWPASPFATEPVALESVQTMHDLERVAEFARMVNFTPRKGRYAAPFSAVDVLWEVHRGLLGRMQFAARPWTAAEDDAWRRAKAVLYESDPDGRAVMSTAFRFYDENRIIYAELEAAGVDAGVLAAAHAAWVAMGHKLEVESALTTLNRLAQRSSLPEATEEQFELDPMALPATSDGSHAATAFSPVSAVSTGTWMSGETTLDDLDSAVGDAAPRGRWDAWRAGRSGTVRFRYAALEIRRPWFTPTLYAADDWRVEDGAVVSRGDGVGGELPAYVASVYVVVVDELRTPAPTQEPAPGHVTVHPVLHPVVVRPFHHVAHRAPPAALSSSTVLRHGVVATARAPDMVASPDTIARRPLMRLARSDDRSGHFGRIGLVTMADAGARLAVARRLVRTEPETTPAPATGTAYVVGFGCAQLPVAPVPNPDYQWLSP